jgi:uncharacterized RmlC-like cupin family protein
MTIATNEAATDIMAIGNCRLVQAGKSFIGKQGLQYAIGISAESVGAEGIHMQLVTIPPGGRARAHKHATHETAIYALSGESGVWHGNRLSTIPSSSRVTSSTSPPTFRTCPTIPARPNLWSP